MAKKARARDSLIFDEVPIAKLYPGLNHRKFFPGLEELASAIESSKWVNTLEIIDTGEIVAGERRYRACCLLNEKAKKDGKPEPWTYLPCMISVLDEKQAFQRNVAENMGRVELRFIEVSRIFQTYRDRYEFSNNEIAANCGYSAETVSRYLSILDRCHSDIIARLDNGEQIPIDFLIKIHTIRDKEVQKLRLEQWLGNPVTESETAPNRQRGAALSRRKMVALVKLLQTANYQEETIQVAQFMAGMRTSLPNKLHLKLSRLQSRRPQD